MMYNKLLEDCFFSSGHSGFLEDSRHDCVCYKSSLPGKGSVLELSLQGDASGLISRACYRTQGNPYMIGALEWLCRCMEGEPLEIHPYPISQRLIELLDIPDTQLPVILRVEDVYQETVARLKKKVKRGPMMTVVMQRASNKESNVRLTDAAKKHILAYLAKNNESKGIRFSVKKTGCSGLSYVIDYVTTPMEEDVVLPLFEHYLLCIDKKSYPYLQGMEVDYVKQGLNYKFVFNNPNQTGQCGCGESFTID